MGMSNGMDGAPPQQNGNGMGGMGGMGMTNQDILGGFGDMDLSGSSQPPPAGQAACWWGEEDK